MAISQLEQITERGRGFEPREDSHLTESQRELVRKIGAYDAPFLRERLLENGTFESETEFEESFAEYKKFVALRAVYGPGQAMGGTKVDKVWHQHILFTPQYHSFCEEMLGEYLHHSPKTSSTPMSENAGDHLISRYNAVFGELPAIWDRVKGNVYDCSDDGSGTCCDSCRD